MSILRSGLYHADSLTLLERLPDDVVDLIYIDPPLINPAEIGTPEYFMRLVFRHVVRVLSPTGNVFVHIAPSMASFLRPLVDDVMGKLLWRSDITLTEKLKHHAAVKFPQSEEMLFYRSASVESIHNNLVEPRYTNDDDIEEMGFKRDENGRLFRAKSLISPNKQARPNLDYEFLGHHRTWQYSKQRMDELLQTGYIHQTKPDALPILKQYADEMNVDISLDWSDIDPWDRRTTYEQDRRAFGRPLALTERIVAMASNPGQIVLDVFSGSGSALLASENLGRHWIGCDNSEAAFTFAKKRLIENNVDETKVIFADDEYLRTNFVLVRKFGKFFLSYSSHDRESFVRPFYESLREHGIDHWWDQQDIHPGDEWEQRLFQGLAECEAMVLFVTPHSMSSEWVQREYEKFIEAGKVVFPMMCVDTPLPPAISKYHYCKSDDYMDKLLPRLLTFTL